ncbi:MAG: 50S ribosomal protein L32, partial [Planctomycetota bacterium]|nr:50S ribosomal protein L32 [Planctomycetota bacterium]
KRKTSHARTRTRRAHHALRPMQLVPCPRCATQKLPHRVCDSCGYYNEKIQIEVKE